MMTLDNKCEAIIPELDRLIAKIEDGDRVIPDAKDVLHILSVMNRASTGLTDLATENDRLMELLKHDKSSNRESS